MAKPLYTLLLIAGEEETEIHFTDYEVLLASKAALINAQIPGLTVKEKPSAHQVSIERPNSAVDYAKLWAAASGLDVDDPFPADEPESSTIDDFELVGSRGDQIMKLLARPDGITLDEGAALLGIRPTSVGALISVTTRARHRKVIRQGKRYRLVPRQPRASANTSSSDSVAHPRVH